MSIFPIQGGGSGGKPGSLLVTSSITLKGAYVYAEVYITNNATLTLAAGASLVTSHLVVDQGATLELQGATVTVDTLINQGTISSTSSSDKITVNIASKLGGSVSLTGTMILQQIGNNNHILFGSISGTGTLEINGIAYVGNNVSIAVATITGAGTLQIASGATLTLENNYSITSSFPTISGAGTLQIASGYTLTIGGNVTLGAASVTRITGPGTLEIPSGYTLTIGGNVTLGVASVTGAGTISIASGATLTIENNLTLTSTSPTITGPGTLQIASGYTLTIGGNVTLGAASVTGAGTLSIPSGYTLTIGGNVTLSATISGAGTISIASGSTLTLENTAVPTSLLFAGSGNLQIGSGVTGGSVSTTTTYYGFYANGVTKLPLGSLSVKALLLFSPNAFSAGSGGTTTLPAGTYFITIASGSSLTITSASAINLAVVYTSSSFTVNTGTTTVDAFTCCSLNGSGSASGSITVGGGTATCSGFTF